VLGAALLALAQAGVARLPPRAALVARINALATGSGTGAPLFVRPRTGAGAAERMPLNPASKA